MLHVAVGADRQLVHRVTVQQIQIDHLVIVPTQQCQEQRLAGCGIRYLECRPGGDEGLVQLAYAVDLGPAHAGAQGDR